MSSSSVAKTLEIEEDSPINCGCGGYHFEPYDDIEAISDSEQCPKCNTWFIGDCISTYIIYVINHHGHHILYACRDCVDKEREALVKELDENRPTCECGQDHGIELYAVDCPRCKLTYVGECVLEYILRTRSPWFEMVACKKCRTEKDILWDEEEEEEEEEEMK